MAASSYTTVALTPETKRRLEGLKLRTRARSMDAVVQAALDEYETRLTAAEIKRLVRHGRAAIKANARLQEFEDAMQGIDASVKKFRGKGRHRG